MIFFYVAHIKQILQRKIALYKIIWHCIFNTSCYSKKCDKISEILILSVLTLSNAIMNEGHRRNENCDFSNEKLFSINNPPGLEHVFSQQNPLAWNNDFYITTRFDYVVV